MTTEQSLDLRNLQQEIIKALLYRENAFACSYSSTPQKIGDELYVSDGRILFVFPFDESLRTGELLFVEKIDGRWQFGHRSTESERNAFAKHSRPLPKVQEVFDGFCDIGMKLPAIEKPLGVDNWAWIWEDTCDECSGSGYVECNYGHEHDCEECDGTGTATDQSEHATRRISIDFNGAVFDFGKWYLWLIGQMPNPRIVGWKPVDKAAYLAFEFEGGKGILCGLNP